MPGASSGYLPPVVADLRADAGPFIRVITEVKSELLDFAKTQTQTQLGANSSLFQTDLMAVKTELLAFAKEVSNAQLGADAAPFWADIAKLRTELAAMSPVDVNVGANVADALRQIAALRGGLALAGVGSMLGGGGAENGLPVIAGETAAGAGRGGIGGLLGGLLGGLGGGGGAAGGGGLMASLGWGGGLFGMAKFGSILSLLGLGGEHAVAMGLGVGGSAIGAGIGGGLLGMGALSTMAVGMGTDAAGMGQALRDIRSVTAAQDQLSQAIAIYGKNSYQAAAAQGQLNYTLSTFAPVARGAILAAANTAEAFHTAFVSLTGEAVKVGAEILNQAMQVGMKFLPTIGKFAAQNMSIIKKDIQPLFTWLQNPGKTGGLGIFTDLEKVFQGQLPTAIHAVTQGIELFAKIADVAAHYTGGFLRAIDHLLTKLNSPAAFGKVSSEVGKLIGLFHTWLNFFIAVGRTVYDIFKPAVGAGAALIHMLTKMLDSLDKWLTKSSTTKTFHNLFSAHLVELIKGFGQAISAALPIIESFAGAFAKVLTVGAKIATILIQPVTAFLKLIDHHPLVKELLGWALAIGLVGKALSGLLTADPVLLGIALAILGIYELVTHWKTVWHAVVTAADVVWALLKRGADDVWHFLDRIWQDIEHGVVTAWDWIKSHLSVVVPAAMAVITGPIGALVTFLAMHWRTIEHGVVTAWHAIINFLRSVPKLIVGALGALGSDVEKVARSAWDLFSSGTKQIVNDVVTFVRGIPAKIVTALGALGTLLYNSGRAVITGFLSGLKSVWKDVTGFIGGIASWISSHKGPIGYDATLLTPHGLAMMQGLYDGLSAGFHGQVLPLIRSMAPQMAGALGGVGMGGSLALGAGARGLGGGATVLMDTKIDIQVSGASGNPQQTATAVRVEVEKALSQVVRQLRAGAGTV